MTRQHDASIEAAVRQTKQKYEAEINDLKQKPTPKPHPHPDELDKAKQQLAAERREKSRLEADNLILVERLKQSFKKRSPVVRISCPTHPSHSTMMQNPEP